MFLTLNELSIYNNHIDTEYSTKAQIEEFVVFCRDLNTKSIIDEIMFPESLFSIPIYKSYGFAQWLADDNVSINHRQFFRRFLDKHSRYYNDQSVDGEFNVSIDGKEYTAVGCAFALEHSNILLSLPTNTFWKNRTICGEYSSLDEYGEMQTSSRFIDNIWTSIPQEEIVTTCRKELSADITSGQDLWDNREQLYPNLVFCENIKDQLFADSEKYHIMAVMKKLDRFQEYFFSCGNSYDPRELGMNARTESETVKSNDELKKLRRFKMPNGNEEYFFDHVSFTGKYNGGRIYFLPDNPNKKCYIGYIGRHLPTKNY